ncbi:MAG: BamA/TamA family outer membrane protein, partial [Gemmatimonadota bacterium]
DDRRLVQRVTFLGVEALSEDPLRDAIATRETRCREFLLRPFCWLTDWDILIQRHGLDPDQLAADELRLRVRYFREGYRQATVRSVLHEVEGGVKVVFRVDEGPPTLLRETEVRQVEEVLRTRDIRRAELPREGEPFSLNDLEEGMEALRDALEELAFLDAKVDDVIEVLPGNEVRLEIVITPGPRSVARELEIRGNVDVDEGTIVRMLRIEEGAPLDAQAIRDSRRGLYESNLFLKADVVIPEQPDSGKVVGIEVREAPPRLARVGGGISTLEFAQLEGRFTHYNWLGGGRRLDVRGTLSNLLARQLTGRFVFRDILPGALAGVDEAPFKRPTWQLSIELMQPHFRAAENVLTVGAFAHRSVTPGISVDEGVGGDVSVTRRLTYRVPLTLHYRHEITSVAAGDVFFCVNFGVCDLAAVDPLRRWNVLSPLALSLLADRSDDALSPTTGYRAQLSVEHASGFTLSDYRYNRLSAGAAYYEAFGPLRDRVVAGQVRAGWVDPLGSAADALDVESPGVSILHPRKRFFAGGARSVRGFAENQLGPRILTIPRERLLEEGGCAPGELADGSCDPGLAPVDAFQPRPIGGSSLLEANVELRFPVGGFTGAVFVDGAMVGGRTGSFLSDVTAAVAPGFGARFGSPVGPIRIDVGLQPRMVQRLRVITEVFDAEGSRELVELEQRRRYDPLEADGFFGRILGRLTLHFSIGEAF